jgi:hypothetical protein
VQPPGKAEIFLDNAAFIPRVPVIGTWEEVEDIGNREIKRAFYGDNPVSEAAHLAVMRTDEYFKLARFADQPSPRPFDQLLAFVLLVFYYITRK